MPIEENRAVARRVLDDLRKLVAGEDLNLRPLGYEHHDARLCHLGPSLVPALSSANSRREVALGRPRLSRLSLSRRVRFTNWFTKPVSDQRLTASPDRTRNGTADPSAVVLCAAPPPIGLTLGRAVAANGGPAAAQVNSTAGRSVNDRESLSVTLLTGTRRARPQPRALAGMVRPCPAPVRCPAGGAGHGAAGSHH